MVSVQRSGVFHIPRLATWLARDPESLSATIDRFCPLGGRGLNGGAETADRPGQDGRDFARGRKSCRYVGVALRFPGPGFGGGRGAVEPDEVKLPAVEQFPLNFITRP